LVRLRAPKAAQDGPQRGQGAATDECCRARQLMHGLNSPCCSSSELAGLAAGAGGTHTLYVACQGCNGAASAPVAALDNVS
jgi:hypothetical protein